MTYSFSVEKLLFVTVTAILVSAFAPSGEANAPASPTRHELVRARLRMADNPAGVEAFSKTAHVFLKRQCSFCHGDTQAPLFALDDVSKSYAAALPLVNFNDIPKSKLVVRAMNGHCGLDFCETDGKEIIAAIQEWAKSENIEARVRTKEIPMPQLSLTQYTAIQWDLNELEPKQAGLEDAKIQVEALAFSEDSILFRRPRIIAGRNSIYVKDLVIELNGEPIQKGKYKGVEKIVTPGAPPPVLSVDKIIIPAQANLTIRLSLGQLGVSQALAACNNVEMFQTKVYPVMADRECFFCHGGGPKNYAGEAMARRMYDMGGTIQQLCVASMQRAQPSTPLKSPIVWYALGNEAGHPRMIPYVDDIQPEWIDWIKSIVWKK
ncbi:MAG TPA: hypothetical protein VFV50_03495 [Bdellovibrionales bacterium]|nr:hypothetical protein [Bdellovibrionales bacterium]